MVENKIVNIILKLTPELLEVRHLLKISFTNEVEESEHLDKIFMEN